MHGASTVRVAKEFHRGWQARRQVEERLKQLRRKRQQLQAAVAPVAAATARGLSLWCASMCGTVPEEEGETARTAGLERGRPSQLGGPRAPAKVRYEAQPSTSNLRVSRRPAPALACALSHWRPRRTPTAASWRRETCIAHHCHAPPPPIPLPPPPPRPLQAVARLELVQLKDLEPSEPDAAKDDIWPLQLVDVGDASQLDVLHALLGGAAPVVQHYLDVFIFPEAMHFQQTKLSASGQVSLRSHPFNRA